MKKKSYDPKNVDRQNGMIESFAHADNLSHKRIAQNLTIFKK